LGRTVDAGIDSAGLCALRFTAKCFFQLYYYLISRFSGRADLLSETVYRTHPAFHFDDRGVFSRLPDRQFLGEPDLDCHSVYAGAGLFLLPASEENHRNI